MSRLIALDRAAIATSILQGTAIALLIASTSKLPASAAIFTGNSSGHFSTPYVEPDRDPNATFSIENTSDRTTFTSGKPGDTSLPNRLTFSQEAIATNGSLFPIGTLSFFNGQTFDGTNVSSVPLNVELALDSVNAAPFQFQYQLSFDLTLNNAEDYNSNADTILIEGNTQPRPLEFGRNFYQLTLLGFSQDDGRTFSRSLQAFEEQSVDSVLFAKIERAIKNGTNTADIPEPSASLTCFAIAVAIATKRFFH